MSDTDKLKRLIKQEIVDEMRYNPYSHAETITGKNHFKHHATKKLAYQMADAHSLQLKAACFIFGDTHYGFPINEILTIIEQEGFKPESDRKYTHESLGITLTYKVDIEGTLDEIVLTCDFEIDNDLMTLESIYGLGVTDGNVTGNRFVGKIDATGGLSAKIHVLRSFATDGSHSLADS